MFDCQRVLRAPPPKVCVFCTRSLLSKQKSRNGSVHWDDQWFTLAILRRYVFIIPSKIIKMQSTWSQHQRKVKAWNLENSALTTAPTNSSASKSSWVKRLQESCLHRHVTPVDILTKQRTTARDLRSPGQSGSARGPRQCNDSAKSAIMNIRSH